MRAARVACLLLVSALAPGRAAAGADSCEPLLAARGHLLASQRAKAPSRATEAKARAAWSAVPAACRTGIWYATAANLLRSPGASREPLVAEGRRFATPAEALAAGLAACPRDAVLLVYVAYLARIAPQLSPALPPGSCANVDPGDPALRAYVCGSEAIAAGRWPEAEKQLAAIDARRFPDIAQLFAAIRERTGRKLPAPPAPKLACDPFCPMEEWRRPPR